jgi:hypothetical protein
MMRRICTALLRGARVSQARQLDDEPDVACQSKILLSNCKNWKINFGASDIVRSMRRYSRSSFLSIE